MRISGFGRLAVLVGAGAMLAAGAALAQPLIIRAPVSGGGAAVSGPQGPANGAPALAGNPGDQSHPQDTLYSVTLTATDPEGEAVTVTATTLPGWLSDGAGLVQGGSVTLANGATLTLSGTPGAGDHPVSLAIEDAQGLAGPSQGWTIAVGAPATLDLALVNTLTMAGGLWSGSFTIVPLDAELVVGGVAGSLTPDSGASGSLDDGDAWTADTGGLVLSRSGGTITLSGTAEAGQYSLELTPQYAATATPLTLTALDQTKLTADDGAADDWFGHAVALDGDTALIGVHRNDDHGTNSGSVYVFTRKDDGSWTQQAKLTASDAAAADYFGHALALAGDTALIGAYVDDNVGTDSGSVYVFTRSGDGNWTEQAKLIPDDSSDHGYFGWSVALDGDTALIGHYVVDDGSESGSAYVFTGSGASWTQQAKLTAGDAAPYDWFGHSSALDGDTALIGARYDDHGGTDSGSVYVFTRSLVDGIWTWTEQAELTASDTAAGDGFGLAVALDGDTALIGAHGNDDGALNSGSAYVFTWDGSSWTQQAKLTASDPTIWGSFGVAVALDGDTALIGAHGNNSRSAYVFTGSGGSWTQQAKLTALDAAVDDWFGRAVALDGDTALIAAYGNDDAGTDSGSAYLFTRTGEVWTQQAKLTAFDAASNDYFGIAVALAGDTALIGAYRDDDDDVGSDSGSAYLFDPTASLPAGD